MDPILSVQTASRLDRTPARLNLTRGRIQRKTWCTGPYAGVDSYLTLCPLHSQLQHIYHGQPYARVNLNPMPESTLSPCSQVLWIWPQVPFRAPSLILAIYATNISSHFETPKNLHISSIFSQNAQKHILRKYFLCTCGLHTTLNRFMPIFIIYLFYRAI